MIAALLYNNLAMTSPYWCPPSRLCLSRLCFHRPLQNSLHRVALAVLRGGQELLSLKVAPIQPSVTAAFHLQSRGDSDCQMWELVRPRSTGHLTEKKYRVTGHYLCTGIYWGVQNCIFASVQWWNKKLRPVIERHLDSTVIMLFWGMGSHLWQ